MKIENLSESQITFPSVKLATVKGANQLPSEEHPGVIP